MLSVPDDPMSADRPRNATPSNVSSHEDRGITSRWILGSETPPANVTQCFSGIAGLEPLTARVLYARGYQSEADASAFLRPSLSSMHDPALLPNMQAAADRILRALKRGERIVIYGDYDVDGITATAILYHAIKSISPDANLGTYVPHRLDEGYGLNIDALNSLATEGAEVIVSVDCGITAIEEAAHARSLGIDLIITDHHQPRLPGADGAAPLPDAYAIVHPTLPGSQYPFEALCGAGVAYKLAWRLLTLHEGKRQLSPPRREVLLELLSLAALGTVADVVPLVDENRAIVRHGLARLMNSSMHGVRALLESCGFNQGEVDSQRVAFGLAPRLNACGRLGHAADAVRLLTEASADEAQHIAEYLDERNTARREIEKVIAEQACEMAVDAGMTQPECRAIVLAGDDWHPGVIGIVCSRLVERFGRPTILLCRKDGALTGSARSVSGYDLHAALHACREHLDRFGGHAAAAGLGLQESKLDAFTTALLEHAASHLREDQMLPELRYDLSVSASDLTPAGVEQLDRLGPFGQANPPVTLRLDGVKLIEAPKRMGKTGDHLSLRVADGDRVLRLVGWRKGDWADQLVRGMTLDAIIRPKINEWRGQKNIEPEVLDLRLDG